MVAAGTSAVPRKRLCTSNSARIVKSPTPPNAIAVANWLVSQKIDGINVAELAPHFPDWPVRRLNSALNYLDNAKLIHPLKAIDSSPWINKLNSATAAALSPVSRCTRPL